MEQHPGPPSGGPVHVPTIPQRSALTQLAPDLPQPVQDPEHHDEQLAPYPDDDRSKEEGEDAVQHLPSTTKGADAPPTIVTSPKITQAATPIQKMIWIAIGVNIFRNARYSYTVNLLEQKHRGPSSGWTTRWIFPPDPGTHHPLGGAEELAELRGDGFPDRVLPAGEEVGQVGVEAFDPPEVPKPGDPRLQPVKRPHIPEKAHLLTGEEGAPLLAVRLVGGPVPGGEIGILGEAALVALHPPRGFQACYRSAEEGAREPE